MYYIYIIFIFIYSITYTHTLCANCKSHSVYKESVYKESVCAMYTLYIYR